MLLCVIFMHVSAKSLNPYMHSTDTPLGGSEQGATAP